MSAGVSDQRMKGQGNQVINSASKNVETEDRLIPWSQQVDEAAYENLSSPAEGSQSGMYGQSFGQQSSYNYFTRNGDYNNSWNSQQMNNTSQNQQSRKTNNYDDYYNRSDRGNYQNDNIKSVQRGMQNMGLDGGNDSRSSGSSNPSKSKSVSQTSSVPKKMTWASIASQPAKPTLRPSSTSSTLKKKGPGMPPPPMVPGKHNMDIGTWDSPKNGSVLVPPPPPPVIPVPIMEPSPLTQSKSNSGSSNNGPPMGDHMNNANNRQGNKQQGSMNQSQQNYRESMSGSSNNNNMRPPWSQQNNPPPHSKSMQIPTQNQRPNMLQGRDNAMGPSNNRGGGGGGGGYHGNSPEQRQQSPLSQPEINRPIPVASPTLSNSSSNYPVLEELRDKNNYNPPEINLEDANLARFFVIKSYSEDDIHRSIKYEIWCSTEHGNKRLDQAYRERESEGGLVYLFFSVNGSGHFCGMAQMMTPVDYNSVSSVWSQAKWKGTFKVKWIYVKDVPNLQLRHIRLENNENKSVTNSRDTQEVPNAKGVQVLKVLHSFKHTTSIFDDFFHYEKRQEEEDSKKYEPPQMQDPNSFEGQSMSPPSKSHRGGSGDFERGYDKGYHSSSGGSGGGGGGGGAGGGYREKNYNRGGYHNYENRRHDDHRGGYERFQRDGRDNDGPSGQGHYNNIRENSGDFHNNRGFHRNEFRRDDRGHSGYSNRDRESYHDGGFMNRGDGRSGGGFRDHYNRDRGEHNSRGRGRGGGHRN